MQETCSCGASIRARYKRVREWRRNHRHDDPPPPYRETDTYSSTERAPEQYPYEDRIGFQLNGGH